MHHPTRRVKRFKQPLSSIRPFNQFSETSDIHLNFVPDQDRPWSTSGHVRHRQPGQLDTLRSAMLIALVMVTIVLYFVLWELERSSFVSVPKRNLTQSALAASPSNEAASARYPPAVGHQDGAVSNLSGDHMVMASSKPSRSTLFAWPPRITRVPEEHSDTDNLQLAGQIDDRTPEDGFMTLPSFDAAYCHGPCRFLLPIRIGEQESKARVHFMQLLALAKRLNRTIVLPNVGKARMSVCSEWPFDAYYDTSGFALGNDAPESPLAVDLQGFTKWVDGRPVPPNGVVVSLESVHRDRRDMLGHLEDLPLMVEKAEVEPNILSCLGSRFARLRTFLSETALSVSFDSHSLKTDSDASARLVQLLSSSLDMDADPDFDLMMEPGDPMYQYTPRYTNSSYLSLTDIDVLVLDYDLRYPLFAASEFALANFNLHYAPMLYDLADRLSENLGPFLGVHWRMETAPVQNLAWCAASLVSTLHAFLQDEATRKGVRHVWIATDYPRPLGSFMDDDQVLNVIEGSKDESPLRNYGPSRKSSTFRALSVEHDDAIGIFIEAFQPGGELDAWKLTDLAEQLRRYPYVEGRFELNETLLDDSGVFGILDKLVTVQARVFVSGSKECSKTSSFSKQIIEARQESLEAERGKGVIRNVVEHFGRW